VANADGRIRVPDVTDVLEQDHRLVEELFEQYQASADPRLAERICDELTLHTRAEEQLVYPVLGRDVPDGSELEQEAEQEHAEVEELIGRVRSAGFDSDEAPELMRAMQTAVLHHVEEEECEVLPKMRASLTGARLEELGRKVSEFKQRSRPATPGARLDANGSRGKRDASRGDPGGEPTKQELYEQARAEGIEGRSTMSKDELARALQRR
jgi:hypothetical protein